MSAAPLPEPRDTAGNAGNKEDAPYEFAMMTFVNMDSPGLVILPTHRVVHGLPSFSANALRDGARAYFSVEEVDSTIDAARARSAFCTKPRKPGRLAGCNRGPGFPAGPT